MSTWSGPVCDYCGAMLHPEAEIIDIWMEDDDGKMAPMLIACVCCAEVYGE